ncbi:hypothetical protein CS022_07190 [Veronia nyctiphanis]|uniref:Uncharacterized protein n=1 Tax=Veronia nyctiphanis TaxID=1278244 RepID=A0A4Q0YSX6_9GAMM|nr:hypothetical protein CS022_07190 [Veronia nyctiphanis]
MLVQLATLLIMLDVILEKKQANKTVRIQHFQGGALPAHIMRDIGFDDDGFCHRPEMNIGFVAKRKQAKIQRALILRHAV